MSDRYGSNEPPTRGKVLIHTSVGDIDVELWPEEAPMACRNFVQLCLEGYYDRCLFHRIIKGFMAQTGDPTGSGRGGASVYGAPFKDELHSRLRFNHPGVVAMANEEGRRNSCGSQFFLTLGPCEWLNKQHTIFGKVTGVTIYNLLKLNETPVGEGDRPLGDLDNPPRILGVEVISNPFSDIMPRVRASASSSVSAKQPEDSLTSKLAARSQLNKSDTRLVSFGLEEEEEEEEGQPVMVLSNESRERHMQTAARDAKEASPSGKRARATSGNDEHGERREAKALREVSSDKSGERGEAGAGSPSSNDNKSKMDRKEKKSKKEKKNIKSGRESDSRGQAEDQDDYRAMREKLREQHQEQQRRQASAKATAAQPPAAPLSLLEQRRQKYLAKGGERSRQQDTLHMVEAFNEKLRAANRKSQSGDSAGAQQARPAVADDARDYKGGIGENRTEDEGFRAVPSRDWMRTELKFRSHIDDAFRAAAKDEQDLTIIDAATASGKRSIEELQKERSR
jgi:peptidyl-prolyl cis-trans isomerase SDCCAG10